jgi:CHAD domain-containing protein/HD superfamily phosphodiesterase
VPALTAKPSRGGKTTGLRHWMLRVLEECDNVLADFGPDSVHDLRVSLRRCRSLADGLMAIDPDPDWKAMKKAGKRLFQRLGALRDTHVMIEWVEKLRASDGSVQPTEKTKQSEGDKQGAASNESGAAGADSVADGLLRALRGREKEQKLDAQAALEEFDRKQWKQWSRSLPARAARVRAGSALFKHLALERWTEARSLHARALRNRSQVAFHSLRIGIKRFRYIVENFLPVEHEAWSSDLKEMQDVLGEVHDLDVLWSTAASSRVVPDTESRNQWHKRIVAERTKRVQQYRDRMVGENSLWMVWRKALPQGKQIEALATRRMKLWAHALDPDFPHSERVASLALQIYDGLLGWGWKPAVDIVSARSSLLSAALLHDVGKSGGGKGHHKASFEMIREQGSPLGWEAGDLRRAAIIARFHRGALPTRRHKTIRDLLPDEQKVTIQLAAILRLANSLDAAHDGHIQRIRIVNAHQGSTNGFQRNARGLASNQPLIIAAEGYTASSSTARAIATERHLLETVLHRPIMIKPFRHV